jgi:hypothetical protein
MYVPECRFYPEEAGMEEEVLRWYEGKRTRILD